MVIWESAYEASEDRPAPLARLNSTGAFLIGQEDALRKVEWCLLRSDMWARSLLMRGPQVSPRRVCLGDLHLLLLNAIAAAIAQEKNQQ